MRLKRRVLGAVLLASLLMMQSASAAQRVRVGAICNDGVSSKAMGSGACSHHKGVKC
jgi:hypothetical protein